MQGFGAWLLALAGPVAIRALAAIGIGTVTYVGADAALRVALDSVQHHMAGITGELAGLLGLAGLFEAVSIISGGMVAALAWAQVSKLGMIAALGKR